MTIFSGRRADGYCKTVQTELRCVAVWLLAIIIVLVNHGRDCFAQENPFPNRRAAASLDGGVEWLNTSGPLELKDLRGKIVLLDFWTFCCINCIHVLPDLKHLETKYNKELVVIGVHSAKFDNEKESGNIRKAILRYEIEHPVINDANMTLWTKYTVQSWPTLVLIDPEGFFCGFVAGEGNREKLDEVIGKLAAYHRAKGTLDERPVEFALERKSAEETPLKFPGKVLADAANDRLYISDSNHNRIVVSRLNGDLIKVIGTGAIGSEDGESDAASFDHPQGMALGKNVLYVADTENHLIRTIDLASWKVATLAGTGVQGHWRETGGVLRKTPLNSPWDLYILNDVLYVAMAGPHQLWSHRIGSDGIHVLAGSGREDILNGPLKRAAFAQPSGISSDGAAIFLADSEGSSIRKVTTSRGDGTVSTVVGASDLPNGRSLFEFGDKDGVGSNVRLQHPLGIVYHKGSLYVADSYNHKIKQINIAESRSQTWLGTGASGNGLDPVQLSEPAGVTIAGDQLIIADTNNHRLLVSDLKTKSTHELVINGLSAPSPIVRNDASDYASLNAAAVESLERKVAQDQPWMLRVKLVPPLGYKINELVPVSVRFMGDANTKSDELKKLSSQRWSGTLSDHEAVFELPAVAAGVVVSKVVVTYGICTEGGSGLCKIETLSWNLTMNVGGDEPKEVSLSAKE